MGIVFVPLYIKSLGIEAYGLIGMFAILQAWMTMLDMGMTPTITREMARYKAGGAINAELMLDLLRSVEWICAGIGLLIVGVFWFASPLLASSWLKLDKLSIDVVSQAIFIMGFVLATRLWEEVYKGAIRGMQQQVWLNGAQAILATFRWAGVLFVIIWLSPTIQAFFIWQGLISLISVLVYAQKTYQWMPRAFRGGQFSIKAIKSVGRFAGGMAVITLLALLLTQIDKLLLSGLLSLVQFGYYALAGLVVGGLSQLIIPINAAIYPKFTELVTNQEKAKLIKTYHDSCQLMAAIIIPPALILSAFAKPILLLWTNNQELTDSVAPILSLLVIGTLLNGLMNVPYMLQLAHGWTGFAVRMNLVAIIIIVPAVLLVVPRYGAIGASWVWVALNAGYVLIGVHFMYRRLLTEQKWRWYRQSVASPLLAGTTVSFGLAYLLPAFENRLSVVIALGLAVISVSAVVIFTLPNVRQRIMRTQYAK